MYKIIFGMALVFLSALSLAVEPVSQPARIVMLTNPDGTGAIYVNGKRLGIVNQIDKNLLVNADSDGTDPDPSPTPDPDEPKFPPCNKDDCTGGAPPPTPTPCSGPFCPSKKIGLVVFPQKTNIKFEKNLDPVIKKQLSLP